MPRMCSAYGWSTSVRVGPVTPNHSKSSASSPVNVACGSVRGMTDPYQMRNTRRPLASAEE